MTTPLDAETVLNGGNATFVAELYAQYLQDPESVDASWVGLFAGLRSNGGMAAEESRCRGLGEDARQGHRQRRRCRPRQPTAPLRPRSPAAGRPRWTPYGR